MSLLLVLGHPPSAHAGSDTPATSDGNAHWVATWGTAPQRMDPKDRPPAPGLTNNTLRQIVHVSIGGERLRLRLSNTFGSKPVTIDALEIAAAAAGSAIHPETGRRVVFDGASSVTIAPGGLCLSDPIEFQLAPGSDLAATMHFGTAPDEVTGHPGARCTSYLQAGDALGAASLPKAVEMPHWYVLSGIDVWAGQSSAAVVVLGDSITDGRGSTEDKNGRWTDDLARRLLAGPRTAHVGVLNKGIGGNRLLSDAVGQGALERFDRDVLEQSGVRWLIVLEGVNDIGNAPSDDPGTTARKVIAGYEEIIRRAHARNVRVYGATITPFGGSFYDSPAREADRQQVNRWIRTSGGFDGVIDFNAAVRDGADPSRLAAPLDSGDHLHLSDKGYEVMAEAIDLDLFTR